MLFGGNSGSCGGCGCKSCQQCTRTCTNPHTGDPFEVVYTLYSGIVGDEIGNPTDGYLTATGDSDTSDPQDGMDGTGPWYQQIEGTFTLSPTTTRHPCRIDISFWRNNYQLGPLSPGQPAPAETLTMNRVTIANQLNSKPVSLGGEVLEPGQTKTYDNIIPKVAGTGDQSLGDPRSSNGTVSFMAACANDTVTVVVKARLEWNVEKRQHIVYGIVRECYEIGTPCNGTCTGGANPPGTLYLTLSNFVPTWSNAQTIAGTYVMQRFPYFCDAYYGSFTHSLSSPDTDFVPGNLFGTSARINLGNGPKGSLDFQIDGKNYGYPSFGVVSSSLNPPCGTGTLATGTATVNYLDGQYGTVDWSVST